MGVSIPTVHSSDLSSGIFLTMQGNVAVGALSQGPKNLGWSL